VGFHVNPHTLMSIPHHIIDYETSESHMKFCMHNYALIVYTSSLIKGSEGFVNKLRNDYIPDP
jgi:hypothetical protein